MGSLVKMKIDFLKLWETFWPSFSVLFAVIVTGAVSFSQLEARVSAVEKSIPTREEVIKYHENMASLKTNVEQLYADNARIFKSLAGITEHLMEKRRVGGFRYTENNKKENKG